MDEQRLELGLSNVESEEVGGVRVITGAKLDEISMVTVRGKVENLDGDLVEVEFEAPERLFERPVNPLIVSWEKYHLDGA